MFQNWKWATIREHILIPMLSRLGTMAATFMLAHGVAGELAAQVAAGAVALGCVLFDLVVGYANRKAYAQRKEGEHRDAGS